MILAKKVRLYPSEIQEQKLWQSVGTARFIYNWTLAKQEENYKNGGKFIPDGTLRKEITQLKKNELNWLSEVSNNVAKQAVKDACTAYKNFFSGIAKYPKFKSKRKSKPGFYADTSKIKFTETHVILEKLTESRKKSKQKFNAVKLAEKNKIPVNVKYSNPRVTFDGLNWWISVGIECSGSTEKPLNEGIGIDTGIKDLAICSDNCTYSNINKTKAVRKL